jgi:hypothetical protein
MNAVRTAVALALAAVAALAFVAPAALADGTYPTAFTKFKYVLKGGDAKFKGAISSPKGACESDRKVKLFRKANGEEKKLGGDHTDGKGKFVIDLGSGPPKNGTYHAEVTQAKAGDSGQNTCLEQSSPKVKLS